MKNIYKNLIRCTVIGAVAVGVVSVVAADSTVAGRHRNTSSEAGEEKLPPGEHHTFANEVPSPLPDHRARIDEEAASIIFTNPASDCSDSMDISWLTLPGKRCKIEVIDESDPHTYVYDCERGDEDFPNDEQNVIDIKCGVNVSTDILDETSLCGNFSYGGSSKENVTDNGSGHKYEHHGYRLYNLKPDTDYSYRIVTYDNKSGKTEHSETRHFHTAGAKEWKAAILGDFHHYAPEPGRLKAAMGMLDVLDKKAGGIDWVLSTGDECAWGARLDFWNDLAEQPGFKNYMWAAVEGNHDSMSKGKDKTDSFFGQTHYFPHDGYTGQQGESYWFRYGDVLFLMLNNEGMLKAGSQQPAIDWMEKVIKDNPSKYVVVVEHHQWLIGTDGTNGQLDRWRKVFDRLGVDLAISGHNHAYLRTYPLYDRKPVKPGSGTVYVVNSSSDNERGRALKPIAANRDIIADRWSEGSHTVGGMVMDVNPQRIAMTLYDRNGHVEDSFTVPSKR